MDNTKNNWFGIEPGSGGKNLAAKNGRKKPNESDPPNLGKAIRLPVPDFNDPDRSPVCLEIDFPITPINALARLEATSGAAKKPIYQMSKWWARRQSSVFRSILIAAATEAPLDPSQAAKLVWDNYYCNHQKAGHFRKLNVLDIFMGGGTTLVEGARLGFQMTGVDLNPVAWFVTKNELACSDPGQVKALFNDIKAKVQPLVQPFYITTCPRGHIGHWIDKDSGDIVDINPAECPPAQRSRYAWKGPEIIYTFWAKHAPCRVRGCNHRTPVFRSPIIAEKKMTGYFIPTICPSCGHKFNIELGETRIAPGAERVVLENEPDFTETRQEFAQLLKDYSKGNKGEKKERIRKLRQMVDKEPGLRCPRCDGFAGQNIKKIIDYHSRVSRVSDIKKKDFGIESRHIYMYLLIHPRWFEGISGFDDDVELGGFAGADPEITTKWFEQRLEGMSLVEVRGRVRLTEEDITEEDNEESGEDENNIEAEDTGSTEDRKKFGLPQAIVLANGTYILTQKGTVPQDGSFICGHCGKEQSVFSATAQFKKTEPMAPYALQCYCPQCQEEGYCYNGRYFKSIDLDDVKRLVLAEWEWATRKNDDLTDYWPRQKIPVGERTTKRDSIQEWGYTHWWKMFNSRQLLVHTQLLRTIMEEPEDIWPLDVREQLLGALQQYLRSMSMFSFYHLRNDQLAAALSNPNFHPKQLVLETCVFNSVGSGRLESYISNVIEALHWIREPSEPINLGKGASVVIGDAINAGAANLICGSSTDLSIFNESPFDLVITDPPFGNNLFYADLADFFYVWLRLPLLRWYQGMPEFKYFEPDLTPHALEAIDNSIEHPDDREDYEKEEFITNNILEKVRQFSGNKEIMEKDPNPLYQPEPSTEFYKKTLSACWTEAGRFLKPGGLMAFTFHHSQDTTWVSVLASLFDAGYVLVATYPIRSDERKGERAQFGSQSIEYDIIHVCRKRLEEPRAVSWARMRRWVKDEATQLKELLENSHGKDIPESDLLVILRGKALEFYSRHYGQVFTGDGQVLSVKAALLGINQLLEDLLAGKDENGNHRPPDTAEPASRLFLRLFKGRQSMSRDELHKTLRGTGVSQGDLEARGWIRVVGTSVKVIPILERFEYFTAPGRNRKVLKTDLDQAHFLIGAATTGSGVNLTDELNRATLQIKRSVEQILDWYSRTDPDETIQQAARLALNLLGHWRAKPAEEPTFRQMTLFEKLEMEVDE